MTALPAPIAAPASRAGVTLPAATVAIFTLVGYPIVGGLAALLFLPFDSSVAGWLGQTRLEPIRWMLPLAILVASTYAAQQARHLRQRQFRLVPRARIGPSAVVSGDQIAFGVASVSAFGLLMGRVLNALARCFRVTPHLIRDRRRLLPSIGCAQL